MNTAGQHLVYFRGFRQASQHEGHIGETNLELISSADRRRPFKLWELQSLLTPRSKERFILPTAVNHDPAIEPGDKKTEWDDDGHGHGIYLDNDDGVVTKTGDASNRLHVRHSEWGCFVHSPMIMTLHPASLRELRDQTTHRRSPVGVPAAASCGEGIVGTTSINSSSPKAP